MKGTQSDQQIRSVLRVIAAEMHSGLVEPERAIGKIKALMVRHRQASPQARSDMLRAIFGVEWALTVRYGLLKVLSHAKAAKAAIQKALLENHDNVEAWQDYGIFLVGVDGDGEMAESALSLNTTREFGRVITFFRGQKNDVKCQLILDEVLRRYARRVGELPPDLGALRQALDSSLPWLEAATPDVTLATRKALEQAGR